MERVCMSELQVLYVAGPGRSGSTLLTDILGQLDGWANVGELMFFWRNRAANSARSCGCGVLLSECEFWQEVAQLAPLASSISPETFALIYDSRASRRWPNLLRRDHQGDANYQEWRDALGELYGAVAKVSGAKIIVDSSKQPPSGLVATAQQLAPVSILQVTRDPRAVATSWLQPKSSEKFPDEHLFAMRPARSAYDWMAQSAATGLVLKRRVPKGRFWRLAYEDFVEQPRPSLERIVAWMGDEAAVLPFTGERTVSTEPTHSIAGNPDRHGPAIREIRNSERWRQDLPTKQRRLVSLMTSPLRWRYGYR